MASIPLSGQIRLGNHFNSQFYYGSNDAAQNNMNSDNMRDYSVGYYGYGSTVTTTKVDGIPYSSGAQRNLGMYRGGTGRYPSQNTTSTTTSATSQDMGLVSGGGPGTRIGYYKATNPNMVGSGDADQAGVNIVGASTGGTTSGNNTATILAHDVGYLEPGTYVVAFSGGHYNTGNHILIVRGYASPHLTGASTDYVYSSRSCTWSGGWTSRSLGAYKSFTVNATYPYVILDLETHVDTNYYLNTSINRKDSSSQKGNSTQLVNPNIWRES